MLVKPRLYINCQGHNWKHWLLHSAPAYTLHTLLFSPCDRLIASRDSAPTAVSFIASKLKELMSHKRCSIGNAKELLRLAQLCALHCNDGQCKPTVIGVFICIFIISLIYSVIIMRYIIYVRPIYMYIIIHVHVYNFLVITEIGKEWHGK